MVAEENPCPGRSEGREQGEWASFKLDERRKSDRLEDKVRHATTSHRLDDGRWRFDSFLDAGNVME